MTIIEKLSEQRHFSHSEVKIANFILSNPTLVLDMSSHEIALKSECSISSVKRLCKKLCEGGIREFRLSLANEITPYSLPAYFADYHVHSHFSTDSSTSISDYYHQAIKVGLKEVCFTDHVDYDVKNEYTNSQTIDYEAYFAELSYYKELYKDELTIKIGVEFGLQLHTIEQYKKDATQYDFDFILLSSHEIDNQEFWLYQFQAGKSQIEYNRLYYKNLKAIISRFHDFDVIGHLDVIRRYDKGQEYCDEEIEQEIENILKLLISHHKGIEINSSSFSYGMKDFMPRYAVLKKYHELGGKIITFGSDAHQIDRLGSHYNDIVVMLKEIGFKHLCTFDKRKPIFHEI